MSGIYPPTQSPAYADSAPLRPAGSGPRRGPACGAETNAMVRPRYLVGSATGGPRMQWWRGIALATGSIVTIASTSVFAQQTRRVTAGAEYDASDTARRWLGNGYRDIWTEPFD